MFHKLFLVILLTVTCQSQLSKNNNSSILLHKLLDETKEVTKKVELLLDIMPATNPREIRKIDKLGDEKPITNNMNEISEALPSKFRRLLNDFQNSLNQVHMSKAATEARFDTIESQMSESIATLNATFVGMTEHVTAIKADKKLEEIVATLEEKVDMIENQTVKRNKLLENTVAALNETFVGLVEEQIVKQDRKFGDIVAYLNATYLEGWSKAQAQVQSMNIVQDNLIEAAFNGKKRTENLDGKLSQMSVNNFKLEERVKEMDSVQDKILRNMNKALDPMFHVYVTGYDFACCELSKNGITKTGNYQIRINGTLTEVRCDMDTEGGGWTVIQRRTLDGIDVNFTRGWKEYEQGFGEVPYSYWIGLSNIAELTKESDQEILIDMESFSNKKVYANYERFHVSGPEDKYRLSIGNYSGPAGDNMKSHNGMQFSVEDNDNDSWENNCAKTYKSGWWYSSCHYAHPNGILYSKETYTSDSAFWFDFNYYNSMKFIEMKIRNNNPAHCGI